MVESIFQMGVDQLDAIVNEIYFAIGILIFLIAIPTAYLMVKRIIEMVDYSSGIYEENKITANVGSRISSYDEDDLTKDSVFNENHLSPGQWNSEIGDKKVRGFATDPTKKRGLLSDS